MTSPFPLKLHGDRFALLLVHPGLDLPFEELVSFRDSLVAETPFYLQHAGFATEVRGARSWSDLCPAGDDNGGRYLVVHPDAGVVGIVLFWLLAADRASYGRFVYRARRQRHGVEPDAVVERVMVWMWRQGIREVETGEITGPVEIVHAHLARCGFEPGPDGEMVRRLAHSATTATSRAIYEDALDAYQRETHPCHHFRALQRGVPDDQWQLPEPFAGAWARRRIVFFGMNPSYRAGVPADIRRALPARIHDAAKTPP